MKLTILGCHSAVPRINTPHSAQVLEIQNRMFLIDCGEGTQVQLRTQKIKFSKIKHIFISHLHGDHVFGLIGLISTFRLLNREAKIHVYGPIGIKELIVTQLRLTQSYAGYPIEFHELSSKEPELIYEDKKVTVTTIPLKHRIYTNGFLFEEKEKPRGLNISEVNKYPEIETCDYNNLKLGKDFQLSDGSIILNKELTFDPPAPLRYAFCSDTMYNPEMVSQIDGVDLLYHEATFLDDFKELAEKTNHSTAAQAATIAKLAKVKKLVLGHFSARYPDTQLYLEEAKTTFKNVELAAPGKIFEVSISK
ncbi:ribonuclease Z [Urechidicola sp. KH5]